MEKVLHAVLATLYNRMLPRIAKVTKLNLGDTHVAIGFPPRADAIATVVNLDSATKLLEEMGDNAKEIQGAFSRAAIPYHVIPAALSEDGFNHVWLSPYSLEDGGINALLGACSELNLRQSHSAGKIRQNKLDDDDYQSAGSPFGMKRDRLIGSLCLMRDGKLVQADSEVGAEFKLIEKHSKNKCYVPLKSKRLTKLHTECRKAITKADDASVKRAAAGLIQEHESKLFKVSTGGTRFAIICRSGGKVSDGGDGCSAFYVTCEQVGINPLEWLAIDSKDHDAKQAMWDAREQRCDLNNYSGFIVKEKKASASGPTMQAIADAEAAEATNTTVEQIVAMREAVAASRKAQRNVAAKNKKKAAASK